MNDDSVNSITSELHALKAFWVERSEYSSDGGRLYCLPIAELAEGRIMLGISPEGEWVRLTSVAASAFRKKASNVFFLPVLESPLQVVRDKLVDGLKKHELSENFVNSFPFEEIVIAGLQSEHENWTKLALKWVECVDPSDILHLELRSLTQNGETQEIRHLAQRLLKKRNWSQIDLN